MLKLNELVTPGNALPYGWIGVIAAFQFGIWYYLGIEGTTQAAEEVRSPARSLPYGTMCGMITLLIAAAMTWYVCASLMPWQYLGITPYPLWDAGKLTGSPLLEKPVVHRDAACRHRVEKPMAASMTQHAPGSRLAATVICRAGSQRCIPKYRTPYRSILFLLPIALAFAFIADLNQAITFSILSGVLQYTFMSINIIMFRKKWPLGTIRRGYTHPFHPLPAIVLFCLCVVTFFRHLPRLRFATECHGRLLLPDLAVVPFLSLQIRAARRPVHHAVAEAAGLLMGDGPSGSRMGQT